MDPQLNAQAQVGMARLLQERVEQGQGIDPGDVGCLCALVLALAEWRAKGGAAPDWARALGQR